MTSQAVARRGQTSSSIPSSSSSPRGLKSWDALEARRSVPISFNLVPARRSRVKPTVGGSSKVGGQEAQVRDGSSSVVGATWLCPILQAQVNGAIVIRILDPEHKEPFVGLGGIFEAAGLSIVEGLLRFNLRRDSNDFDITLAGVEPFDEIWASLSMARAVADELDLLDRLAALLSWSSRHIWSLDEGEAGLIHNWRAPANVIEPSIYSTAALLNTSMPKVELMPRGEQIRTLLSRQQRQAAIASDSAPVVSQMRCRLLNWSVRCYEALLELVEEEGWEDVEESGQTTPTGKRGEGKQSDPTREDPTTPGLCDLVTLLNHLTMAGSAQRDDEVPTDSLVAGSSTAWHRPLSIAQGRLKLSAEELHGGTARMEGGEPSSPSTTARAQALLDARLRLAEVHLLWKTARMLLVPGPAPREGHVAGQRSTWPQTTGGFPSSPSSDGDSRWPSSPLSASEVLASPTSLTANASVSAGDQTPGMSGAHLEATLERLDRRMRRSTVALDRIHQLLLDASEVSSEGQLSLRGRERSGSGSTMSIGKAAQKVARTSVEARKTGNLVALWGVGIVVGLVILQIIGG